MCERNPLRCFVATVSFPFGGDPYKKAATTAPPTATAAIHCQLLLVVVDAAALWALVGSLIESLIEFFAWTGGWNVCRNLPYKEPTNVACCLRYKVLLTRDIL
jgi:hypothetical protein